jgi:hypothetical protein
MKASHTASREFENQPDPGLSTLCKTKSGLPYCKLKLKPINGKTRNSVFSNYTPNALHITKHDKPSHVSPVTVDLRPRVDTQTKPNAHILHTNDKQTKRTVELNRATFTQQSAGQHIVPRCNRQTDHHIPTQQRRSPEVGLRVDFHDLAESGLAWPAMYEKSVVLLFLDNQSASEAEDSRFDLVDSTLHPQPEQLSPISPRV